MDTSPDSPLLALCEAGAYSSQVELLISNLHHQPPPPPAPQPCTQVEVAARGKELLTVLAREGGGDLGGEAVAAIETLCLLLSRCCTSYSCS